jgi:hypothetical protein
LGEENGRGMKDGNGMQLRFVLVTSTEDNI